MAGSLKKVASEMAKCSLDLVVIQEARWVGGDSQPADDVTYFSM